MPPDVLRPAIAIGVIIGGAGVSILTIEKLRHRPLFTSTLVMRWGTWCVLATAWVLAVIMPWFLIGLLVVIGLLTAGEFAALRRMGTGDRWLLAIINAAAIAGTASGTPLEAVLLVSILVATLPGLFAGDPATGTKVGSDLLLGVVVVVVPLISIQQVSHLGGALLLALLLGVALSDVGAFMVGTLLGRHLFAPRLSPRKTWEGVLGNLIGAYVGVAIVFTSADLTGTASWVLPAVIAVGAIWGDLLESLLKRARGVKDAGTLLPGFGGLLDRLDSLIVAAPLSLLVLRLLGP